MSTGFQASGLGLPVSPPSRGGASQSGKAGSLPASAVDLAQIQHQMMSQFSQQRTILTAAGPAEHDMGDQGLALCVDRREELKRAVQLGVMRGLSSQRSKRKNSRMSRITSPGAIMPDQTTYMQIKMRSDGVVPFQNTLNIVSPRSVAHSGTQPFYLAGAGHSGVGNSPQNQQHVQRPRQASSPRVCSRLVAQQQKMRQVQPSAVEDKSKETSDKQQHQVSQMGSQTSTDKFNDGGTKNTQTNHSINETFELTNIIGGASIEMQDPERTASFEFNNNVGLGSEQQNPQHHATTNMQVGQNRTSKLEEAHSSIDQPSFQTEHEATFLWNNAKIIQNSLVGANSPSRLVEVSPKGNNNRKSDPRNSLTFDSMLGQKMSHKMSTDSPRRAQIAQRNGQLKKMAGSYRQRNAQVDTLNGSFGLQAGHSVNYGQQSPFEKPTQPHNKSPPLNGAFKQSQTTALNLSLHNRDLIAGNSVQVEQLKLSTNLSPRKQISARESIQEKIKMATMNQIVSQDRQNQIGIQGHSMQLVSPHDSKRSPTTTQTSKLVSTLPAKDLKSQSVKDYEAIILAHPSKQTGTDELPNDAFYTGGPTPKVSNEGYRRSAFTKEQGLSKNDTQVGVVDIVSESRPVSPEQERLVNRIDSPQSPVTDLNSPDRIEIPADTQEDPLEARPSEGGLVIGRANTITIPVQKLLSIESKQNDSGTLQDTGTVKKEFSVNQEVNSMNSEPNQTIIACEITTTAVDQKPAELEESRPKSRATEKAAKGESRATNQIATQLLVLDNTGDKVSCKGEPGAPAKQPISLEIQSAGKLTNGTRSNSGSDDHREHWHDSGDQQSHVARTLFSDEILTSETLQSKIGNLALTFPNAQQTHPIYFRKVSADEPQDPQSSPHFNRTLIRDPNYMAASVRKNISKPRTGDRVHRKRADKASHALAFKPDLCNINPDALDEGTLRNMHAIGISYASKCTNKLKPFQSQAKRLKQWRDHADYVAQQHNRAKSLGAPLSNAYRDTTGAEGQSDWYEATNYDGTSSHVADVKILKRRLTAWPTHDKASGLGDMPDRLVGTTTASNAVDQVSFMNTTHGELKKCIPKDQLLSSLPEGVRNLQTPSGVKSAVGSSRIQAKIQLRALFENSQANTLNYQKIDPAGKERNLQTQGCQRSPMTLKARRKGEHSQIDSKKLGTSKTISPSAAVSGKSAALKKANLQHIIKPIRNDSMVCTPDGEQSIFNESESRPCNDYYASSDGEQTFRQKSGDRAYERPKLGSFSLQVRRRTDQQSNFLSRTKDGWYTGPIEVTDQKVEELRHQQRSVDVTEAFRNSKVKQIAAQRNLRQNENSQNGRELNDSMGGSQISMQLDELPMAKSAIGADTAQNAGVNFETQKFVLIPKKDQIKHKMKGFCCEVPGSEQGRGPYQNTMAQKPGLSPKTPVMRHGIFGPSHGGSLMSRGISIQKKQEKQLKQFSRPMQNEVEKCQVQLHQNINNALKKKKAPKITLEDDTGRKNRVNRADLRQIKSSSYHVFMERVQSLHVPRLLGQFEGTSHSSKNGGTQQTTSPLGRALNDPSRVNAYAVLNFKRDVMPGSLHGRKLHTSQLSVTPQMNLEVMLEQPIN